MAWVIGIANDDEIRQLQGTGRKVIPINETQLKALLGDFDAIVDSDPWIMYEIDCDASALGLYKLSTDKFPIELDTAPPRKLEDQWVWELEKSLPSIIDCKYTSIDDAQVTLKFETGSVKHLGGTSSYNRYYYADFEFIMLRTCRRRTTSFRIEVSLDVEDGGVRLVINKDTISLAIDEADVYLQ